MHGDVRAHEGQVHIVNHEVVVPHVDALADQLRMRVIIRKIRCEPHDDCVRAPESAAGKQLFRPAARKRLGNGSIRQHRRLRRILILYQTAIRHSDDVLPPVILHIGFERVRSARQERLILRVRQIFHFPHGLKQLERHRPRNRRSFRR